MAYSLNHGLFPKRAISADGTPTASQSTTVLTVAIAPTGYSGSTTLSAPNLVTLDIQVANIRVRWDGTDPTSSSGHILYAGLGYTFDVDMYNACKFICDGAGSTATIFASPLQA